MVRFGLCSKTPLLIFIIYHTVDCSCYPKHLPFTNNRIFFPGRGEEEERGDAIFLPMVASQKMYSEQHRQGRPVEGTNTSLHNGTVPQFITERYKCFSSYQINKLYRPLIVRNCSINHKITLCDNKVRSQLLTLFTVHSH